MTGEEAVKELEDRYLGMSAYENKESCVKANMALDMAIEALKEPPQE